MIQFVIIVLLGFMIIAILFDISEKYQEEREHNEAHK
jgi:hypothetical protein